MAATKNRAKKRGARAARDKRRPVADLHVWSVRQASEWSGIKYRALMRLIKAGAAPHIAGAPARATATNRRVYLIPRARFVAWLEGNDTVAATGENAA